MSHFAEFVISAAKPAQFAADGLPEFALVGRSNVGKSSLINALIGRHKLARTSSHPGRTQTLNFYRIWPEGRPRFGDPKAPPEAGADQFWLQGTAQEAAVQTGAFYMVDMPGYGYARVSHGERGAWRKLIETYLSSQAQLRAVMQIVDLRHPPSKDDIDMWNWLRHYGKRRLVVATKADKVPRTKWPAHLKIVATTLGIPRAAAPAAGGAPDEEFILPFSAETKTGTEQLWQWLLSLR